MARLRTLAAAAALLIGGLYGGTGAAWADTTLLNVSYDPTRELYQEVNKALRPSGRRSTASGSPSACRTAAPASRPAR
jgi:sulfate/thiosulfate transport system substrate-binding protein